MRPLKFFEIAKNVVNLGMEITLNKASNDKLSLAMERLVRQKAIKAGNSIFYLEGDNIIKENPVTGSKVVVRKSLRRKQR